jgi:hypothetical protein
MLDNMQVTRDSLLAPSVMWDSSKPQLVKATATPVCQGNMPRPWVYRHVKFVAKELLRTPPQVLLVLLVLRVTPLLCLD